jgi:hypothetical protein
LRTRMAEDAFTLRGMVAALVMSSLIPTRSPCHGTWPQAAQPR